MDTVSNDTTSSVRHFLLKVPSPKQTKTKNDGLKGINSGPGSLL